MTWPRTLAGLPRAGTISKPHDYKQKVQKIKGFPKTWVLTAKQFENIKPKKSKILVLVWRTKQKKHKTPQTRQEMNMNHVARKNLTEAKLKKAFRIKLFELCKTRTKKSSPDLFNFLVALAGHEKVTDAKRATSCRRKIKAIWLRTKIQKMKDVPKMNFTEKLFEDFRPKRKKFPVLAERTKQRNHGTLKAKSELEPMQSGGNKLKQTLKMLSDWNCGNFARLELRSHVLSCSFF